MTPRPDTNGGSDEAFPLSIGQQALWFLQQTVPESSAYHCLGCARITSAVDVAALERTIAALARRNPMLRARYFSRDGVPMQRVEADPPVAFSVVDATRLDDAALERAIHDAMHEPFDLEHGPVYRFRLFRRGEQEHRLAFAVHHLSYDGASSSLVFRDLRALYMAERGGPPPPPAREGIAYRDFVAWQRQFVASEAGEKQWLFWKSRLAGDLPQLELPTDFPRRTTRLEGGSVPLRFTVERSRRLHDLAKAQGVTLYMLLLAAWQILLARYSRQDDVLVGAPAFGRTQSSFHDVVGYFVNPIVFRSDLSRNPSFLDFLAGVRTTVLEAVANQDLPFPELVRRLAPRRDPTRNPVFQAFIDWQKREWIGDLVQSRRSEESRVRFQLGELALDDLDVPQQEGLFDLTLDVKEAGEELFGELKYDAGLFRRDTIERMEANLQALLDGIVADPRRRVSQLPILSPEERKLLVVDWNATQREFPRDCCIHELFEMRVKETPDAIAVTSHDGALTYAELNARANRLARRLRREGVLPDAPVGILHQRSTRMLVGMLGILKAGGGYVPLDPDYPADRLDYMVANSGLACVVTESALAAKVSRPGVAKILLDADAAALEQESAGNVEETAGRAGDLAYLIYTSGSTGRPKGVEVLHRGVVNCLNATARLLDFGRDDRLVAVTTIAFDIHAKQLFLPLVTGGTVDVVEPQVARDARLLLERMKRNGPAFMQATPTQWQMLVDSGWEERLPIEAITIGEPLSRELAGALLARCAALWNTYGPTEATIQSTVQRIGPRDEVITLGRPFDNTSFYVVDPFLQPVPIGVAGELVIGGDGVARGYHELPEKTAERFLASPFRAGERIYRTGDLVRLDREGQVEMIDRIDHQVKLRGFRIELGEIEAVLEQHEEVKSAVVKVVGEAAAERRLVAFAVPKVRPEPSRASVRRTLREKLPDYMVPAEIVWLDALPLMLNGKIDRNALRVEAAAAPARDEAIVPPEGPAETLLARVVGEVVGVARVGAFDSFYDLGGNSLLSLKVVDRIEQESGFRMNPADLVHQTVRQIATRHRDALATAAPDPSASSKAEKKGWLGRLREGLPGD
jgi:amino acid adenylation domain-containing protein